VAKAKRPNQDLKKTRPIQKNPAYCYIQSQHGSSKNQMRPKLNVSPSGGSPCADTVMRDNRRKAAHAILIVDDDFRLRRFPQGEFSGWRVFAVGRKPIRASALTQLRDNPNPFDLCYSNGPARFSVVSKICRRLSLQRVTVPVVKCLTARDDNPANPSERWIPASDDPSSTNHSSSRTARPRPRPQMRRTRNCNFDGSVGELTQLIAACHEHA